MHEVSVQFLAAKTRVTPVVGTTIPRLELLSALLLSKLMSSVHAALEQELNLSDPLCFSDSKVALFWIQGTRHEWKQFVENRVNSIRRLIAPQHWKHCPGRENPADIPSKGMSVSELVDTSLWLHGPVWLQPSGDWTETEAMSVDPVPDECRREMKVVHQLVTVQDCAVPLVSNLVNPERHSSTYRLYRVTALILNCTLSPQPCWQTHIR